MLRYLKATFGIMSRNDEKVIDRRSSTEIRACSFDGDGTNGLILSDVLIPEEVIAIVLNYLPWKELLPCRLVCRTWKDIVDFTVCHEKINTLDLSKVASLGDNAGLRIRPTSLLSPGNDPFYVIYAIGTKFGKNLLKNPFGNVEGDKFASWEQVEHGGNGWRVEEEPWGCDALPEHLGSKSCFASSYRWSSKLQWIRLQDCGLNPMIMDEIQPDIKVSEWCATRSDCGSIYRMKVCLVDDQNTVVSKYEFEKRMELWEANVWNEVSHTFSGYGRGVRAVLFKHGGVDTQFWAGHYGSKMAGGEIVALLPNRFLQQP